MDGITDIAKYINNSSILNAIALLCSIFSLFITIKVDRSLKKSNERKFYNENHTIIIDQFVKFKNILTSDISISSRMQSDIFAILISIESQCSSVFTIKDRYVMLKFKSELKNMPINCDKNRIIEYLAYWIGRLQKKADN